jgi:hypothetical protein
VADIEFELEFGLDGWQVFNIPANTGDYVLVENQPQGQPPGVHAIVIYWMGEQTVDQVTAQYRSLEMVDQATEPASVTVGGSDAVQFDLLLATNEEADPGDACDGVTMHVDNMSFDSGHFFCNFHACAWIRVWVVQVDEFAVSVHVQAVPWDGSGVWQLDPDNVWQIEDLQPLLDDFINGLTFCTAASPCDD